MPTHAFTIGKLANIVGINGETIRYYQRRSLLEEPLNEKVVAFGAISNPMCSVCNLSNTHKNLDFHWTMWLNYCRYQQQSMANALAQLADCCACPIVAALTIGDNTLVVRQNHQSSVIVSAG